MNSKAYVVTVIAEVIDRENKKTLHSEDAVVIFCRDRDYLGGSSMTHYSDDFWIADHVKRFMVSTLYSRNSMSADNPVRVVREKIVDRPTFVDSVVVHTREFESFEELKLRKKQWMVQDPGHIFDGIVNPYD